MIIVGIDPGTIKTGYAVIEQQTPGFFKIKDLGVWFLTKEKKKQLDHVSLGDRMELLYERSNELFKTWNPRYVGLERAVTFKNIPSALKLSEARGVIRLSMYTHLAEASKRLIELSPTQIKKYATGNGQASKSDIEQALEFRFPDLVHYDAEQSLASDAFDALAVAWTASIVHKEIHGGKIRSAFCD